MKRLCFTLCLLALCAVSLAFLAGCGNAAIKSIEQAGDKFEFGEWLGEPVVWRVLEVEDGRALVISEDILCLRQHDSRGDWLSSDYSYSWENSEIRNWLNRDFLDTAFSSDERKYIPKSTIATSHKVEYNMNDADNPDSLKTEDYLFLLSSNEARKYFPYTSDGSAELLVTQEDRDNMLAQHSDVAQYSDWGNSWYYDDGDIATANYLTTDEFFIVGQKRPVDWWLRSNGVGIDSAVSFVINTGMQNSYSSSGVYHGVRPVMWIDLNGGVKYWQDEAKQNAYEEYHIDYDLDGGFNNKDNPATYTEADLLLTIKEPSKEGFVFEGWVSDELDVGVPEKNMKIPVGTVGDVTLSAIFHEKLTLYENVFDFDELPEDDFPRGVWTVNQLNERYGEPVELRVVCEEGYGKARVRVDYEDMIIVSGHEEPSKFSAYKESVETGWFGLSEADKDVSFEIFTVERKNDTASLPRDIKIGVSTREQIIASYPEDPVYSRYDEDGDIVRMYNFRDENGDLPTLAGFLRYSFDENNILKEVDVRYWAMGE